MDKNITNGDKVRLIRKKSGFSQSVFAEKLGVKQSYLSGLENNKRDITAKVIDSLRRNFNVSSDWLLSNNLDEIPVNYNINITDSYKSSELIENNINFIKHYFHDLRPGTYEYKMIIFYEDENMPRLRVLKESALKEFKQSYLNNLKLIEVLHCLLSGSENYLLEKFPLLPDFKKYLSELEKDRKEDFIEIPYQVDKKLKIILDIVYYNDEKVYYDDMITKIISYLHTDRDWLIWDIKKIGKMNTPFSNQ